MLPTTTFLNYSKDLLKQYVVEYFSPVLDVYYLFKVTFVSATCSTS